MYRTKALSHITRPLSLTRYARRSFAPACCSRRKPAIVRMLATAPDVNDGFLDGNAASYIEEMYEAWRRDPSSVHLSWQVYFKNMQSGVPSSQAYVPPPTLVPSGSARLPSLPSSVVASAGDTEVLDHMKIQLLVRAYQVRGHHIAKLDPLGIQHADLQESTPPELFPTYYGFTEKDMDRTFTLGPGILPAFGSGTTKRMTLREILDHLKAIYCKL